MSHQMTTYLERVQAGFRGQGFMELLGARLGTVTQGSCEIILPFRKDLTQQHGFFHGGAIATLADNVGGFAAYTLMSQDEQPLSVEFKINLFSKGKGEYLVARGRVLKNGRRIKVCQADVFCRTGEEEKHCAVALVTVIAVKDLEHGQGIESRNTP